MPTVPKNPQGLPTQTELLLPLLEIISDAGGELKPADAISRLAERLGIPPELRESAVASGKGRWEGRRRYVWKNRVAWTRMNAVERDYIDSSERGCWRLTKKARRDLLNVQPGIVLKIYETASGTALWATAEAASGVLSNGSINLVFSSPAYQLVRGKKYGNPHGHDFIQWLVNLGREWRRVLVDDGSLVLNFGTAWVPGQPCQSEYQERVLLAFIDELKFHLAQRLVWYNPCKLPSSPWVTKSRIRLSTADEALFWLGKGANPFADTRPLLREYSSSHRKRLASGTVSLPGIPSGHVGGGGSFVDRGGSIPHSVITAANSNSRDPYLRQCRELGLEPNPARMPVELAETVIKLTTRPGDVVYDPMMGSNVVGFAAERLGRRWIGNDISLTYGAGSALRFPMHHIATADIFEPLSIAEGSRR